MLSTCTKISFTAKIQQATHPAYLICPHIVSFPKLPQHSFWIHQYSRALVDQLSRSMGLAPILSSLACERRLLSRQKSWQPCLLGPCMRTQRQLSDKAVTEYGRNMEPLGHSHISWAKALIRSTNEAIQALHGCMFISRHDVRYALTG